MIELKNCPVCQHNSFQDNISCKDYTVSQESFNIVECRNCGFKFTNPRPSDEEIGSYYQSEDYISHSDTKKGLVSRLYHAVRNYTLKRKLRLLDTHVSRGTILDYGCGTGQYLRVCKAAGWTCYGMEPDDGARNMAAGMGLKIARHLEDLRNLLGGEKINAITLWHVLEHVTDLDSTLQFFYQALSADGVLIIAVPNHTSADARHYGKYWAAYDVPRHLYHFEPKTLTQLLSRHGFSLKDTKPMKFDSYYVSMLSEKYKTGSVNYLKAFIAGFISNIKARGPGEYSSVIYVFKKA